MSDIQQPQSAQPEAQKQPAQPEAQEQPAQQPESQESAHQLEAQEQPTQQPEAQEQPTKQPITKCFESPNLWKFLSVLITFIAFMLCCVGITQEQVCYSIDSRHSSSSYYPILKDNVYDNDVYTYCRDNPWNPDCQALSSAFGYSSGSSSSSSSSYGSGSSSSSSSSYGSGSSSSSKTSDNTRPYRSSVERYNCTWLSFYKDYGCHRSRIRASFAFAVLACLTLSFLLVVSAATFCLKIIPQIIVLILAGVAFFWLLICWPLSASIISADCFSDAENEEAEKLKALGINPSSYHEPAPGYDGSPGAGLGCLITAWILLLIVIALEAATFMKVLPLKSK